MSKNTKKPENEEQILKQMQNYVEIITGELKKITYVLTGEIPGIH